MNIQCPKCGQDHEVEASRIPAAKFKAGCRGCKEQFVVVVVTCDCGARFQQGRGCPACATERERGEQEVPANGDEPVAQAPEFRQMETVDQVESSVKTARESHQVQFSGRGGEFFRIWIVNLFLTIVTVGIYTPWAKVRTRQYFYAHTTIAGEPFEYLADPMILLRGYLLIGGGFLVYSFSQVVPVLSGLILLFFYIGFPWLVFKSLRFYAHNSSFKNVRFQFLGSIGEAYTTYLALPIAIPFTLGLIVPYWMYYKKRYFFENFAFGATRCNFTAQAKPFYWIYFKAGLMMLVPFCLVGVAAAVIIPRFEEVGGPAMDGGMQALLIGAVVVIYGGLILGSTFVQQYIYARTMNYCWGQSDLGSVSFESTLHPGRLMLIQATNILAVVVSGGLLYPWAKVRKTKYILEQLTLHTTGGLDDFSAASAADEAALGEAAMDFFDFEIGL